MQLIVMAKEPRPGRVKTRLVPPYTHDDAAALAEAALADTLDAALASGADRVVVVLDGAPGDWLPPGCVVRPQRGCPFDERLANAWDDAGGPALQIGMDTPQVRAADIDDAMARLVGTDAVLGMAVDGGWWAIGLHRSDREVFTGVPMSRDDTGLRQWARLRQRGLDVALLPTLRDVDLAADVVDVATAAPGTRFARLVRGLDAVDAR